MDRQPDARVDHFKLASWFSPAYPVGAFSYSHGLEWAIAHGPVNDGSGLANWIDDCLRNGGGKGDAILIAAAYRDPEDAGLDALAVSLQPSSERLLESRAMGDAFGQVTGAAWPSGADHKSTVYPLAVGRMAAAHKVCLSDTLSYYLQAFTANLISVGIRLIPIGQTEGQVMLASLMPAIFEVTDLAEESTLDDLGSAAVLSDIASMKHETQDVRIFRS